MAGQSFDFNKWMEALKNADDPEFYANQKTVSVVLPWDHINIGVTKRFLQKECEKAYKGEVRNCSENCSFCGAQGYKTGICFSEQRSDQKNG